jgi:hypothetical protein
MLYWLHVGRKRHVEAIIGLSALLYQRSIANAARTPGLSSFAASCRCCCWLVVWLLLLLLLLLLLFDVAAVSLGAGSPSRLASDGMSVTTGMPAGRLLLLLLLLLLPALLLLLLPPWLLCSMLNILGGCNNVDGCSLLLLLLLPAAAQAGCQM